MMEALLITNCTCAPCWGVGRLAASWRSARRMFSVLIVTSILELDDHCWKYGLGPGAARKQSGVPQWGTGGSSRLLYFISQPPAASHLRSRDATSQNRGTTEYSATLLGSYQYEIFITFSCNPFSKNQFGARGLTITIIGTGSQLKLVIKSRKTD